MGATLSEDQLVDLVAKVQRGEGTEEEIDAWLTLIEQNVPDPEVADLIFHSKEVLTAEKVIEHALAYRPILLGAASPISVRCVVLPSLGRRFCSAPRAYIAIRRELAI